MNQNNKTMPFVKWIGGKRQLLNEIAFRLPESFNIYFEPFVGGGALYFYLQPEKSVINDNNVALMNVYKQLKKNYKEVVFWLNIFDAALQKIDDKKLCASYYYEKREKYNEYLKSKKESAYAAALFIFLNKHCFNGLYRVNNKGEFNALYNGSCSKSFNEDNLRNVSVLLKRTEICATDFEEVCDMVDVGDFVFLDSPYIGITKNTFNSYGVNKFDNKEHERLARCFRRLSDRSVYVMLTNHDVDLVHELYDGFKIDVVDVRRFVNCKGDKRSGISEVIIRNY